MTSQILQECELLSDSKYRNFISAIEKSLKNFENTSEWADLISALGKLNKVLLNHPKYQVIPKRITIGKRLAQCLHPNLPSGVHNKALETYDIIFKCIGTAVLAQDLYIYSAGLFPLMGYAAMNVKPSLLQLYESHFIPVGHALRPSLQGLLLGTLPGLEEGSEYYDRTNTLLERFCKIMEPSFFYGCFWEVVLTNPSIRLPAMDFVLNHFNKKLNMDDQLYIIGSNMEVLTQALCESVQDSNILVQRSVLDFLIFAFPLHSAHLVRTDLIRIINSVIYVLLRRDMSLNRRLYTWLLGIDSHGHAIDTGNSNKVHRQMSSQSDPGSYYFETYSKDLLVHAIQQSLANEASDDTGNVKPLRLLISLLDKPEVGSNILEDVLLDVFRFMYSRCQCSDLCEVRKRSLIRQTGREPKDSIAVETVKTGNLLFGSLEPWFIWDFIVKVFESAVEFSFKNFSTVETSDIYESRTRLEELCALIEFLLDIYTLETYTETQTRHLPNMLHKITRATISLCGRHTEGELMAFLTLCSKILSKIVPSVLSDGKDEKDGKDSETLATDFAGDHPSCLLTTQSGDDKAKDTTVQHDAGDFDEPNTDCYIASDSACISPASPLLESTSASLSLENVAATPSSNLADSGHFGDEMSPSNSAIDDFTSQEHLSKSTNCLKQNISVPEVECNTSHAMGRTLMQACVETFQEFFYSADDAVFLLDKIEMSPEQRHMSGVFSLACQLLLEFSCFPVYCKQHPNIFGNTAGSDAVNQFGSDKVHLPEWLRILLVLSCFVEDFIFQSTAVHTVLELISLSKSIHDQHKMASAQQEAPSSPQGTVTVLIIPILTVDDLTYISERTNYFKIVAGNLWSWLDSSYPDHHQKAVDLFQQLHNLAQSTDICEDIVGESLIESDQQKCIESFKKFIILWHLTSELHSQGRSGSHVKTFDRAMFLALDRMQNSTGAVRSMVEQWIVHILKQGDLARLIEPLLLILLHPDTARVSVQHVTIAKPKTVRLAEAGDVNDQEAKIYAISSENGNVIYHVSRDSPKHSNHKKQDQEMFDRCCSKSSLMSSSSLVFEPPFLTRLEAEPYNILLMKEMHPFISPPMQKEGSYFDEFSLRGGSEDRSSKGSPINTVSASVSKSEKISDEIASVQSGESEKSSKSENSDSKLCLLSSDNDSNNVVAMVTAIINDIISDIVPDDGFDALLHQDQISSVDINNDLGANQETDQHKNIPFSVDQLVHDVHTHMLLYRQIFDSRRCLYALHTIRSILQVNRRVAVCTLTTTSLSDSHTPYYTSVLSLLARHKRCLFGNNFYGELGNDVTSSFRSHRYLEVIISLCLYFARGFYPNLAMSNVTFDDIQGNKTVHLLAIEVLEIIIAELASIAQDGGKGFASYIRDLLFKCKLQKTILHCLVSAIYDMRWRSSESNDNSQSLTEAVVNFNYDDTGDESLFEAYVIRLLKLVSSLIKLEAMISIWHVDSTAEIDKSRVKFEHRSASLKYIPKDPVAQQKMLLTSVLSALKQQHKCHMHMYWVMIVTKSLPYLGKSLANITMASVNQLCKNLEILSLVYTHKIHAVKAKNKPRSIPSDHVLSLFDGITTICHYCLLETPSGGLTIHWDSPTAGQILNNLINAFAVLYPSKESTDNKDSGAVAVILVARRHLLSILPRIVSCMATMWSAVGVSEDFAQNGRSKKSLTESSWTMGTPKSVKQRIIEFLSPLCLNYSLNLLAAVAVVWNERRKKGDIPQICRQAVPSANQEQLVLVDLVCAIKVMPTDTLIQTAKQVIKQPPPTNRSDLKTPLEVSLLQFFYAYVQRVTAGQLQDSWPSLLSLLKECLQLELIAQGRFLLFLILNTVINKMPAFQERKEQKDLQEVTQKLVEACSFIAGLSLEQTTWFRKNLAVKSTPQPYLEDDLDETPSSLEVPASQTDKSLAVASVKALCLLAEHLAPMLDIVFGSDDKEKVLPLLTNVMSNVTPYLKNHSQHNMPSFRACSQLLSSLSGYQYTRKAWRREVLDLLLDVTFFQMESLCLSYWRAIVDHLMTQDKMTFKDLMSRIATSASLNLFSSREAEYEQRSQLLKKLSFTIFSSEVDQYENYMPDIQERLAECLRMPQAPILQAQVFLCFRVLLIRISPHHLVSLWPTIITEMVHVFLQIEQELSTETEEFRQHLKTLSTLDSSWAIFGNNGLNAHNNPHWLNLYLSVCKLLDLALVLPADTQPQFQLYKWTFTGDSSAERKFDETPEFVPHCRRIYNLLHAKCPDKTQSLPHTPGHPILTVTSVHSLQDLKPFFSTICNISQSGQVFQATGQSKELCHRRELDTRASIKGTSMARSKSLPNITGNTSSGDVNMELSGEQQTPVQFIEKLIELDFLEPLPLQ